MCTYVRRHLHTYAGVGTVDIEAPGTSANRVNDPGSRNNFATFLERTHLVHLCDSIGSILHDNEFVSGSRWIERSLTNINIKKH